MSMREFLLTGVEIYLESIHRDDLKVLGAAMKSACTKCRDAKLPYCTHEISLMGVRTAAIQQRVEALLQERIQASRKRESKT